MPLQDSEHSPQLKKASRSRRKELEIDLPDDLVATDAISVMQMGAELRGLSLTGNADGLLAQQMTWRDCRLDRVSLAAARLERLDGQELLFEHCVFTGAKLPRSALQRALFRGCRMTGVDFPDATLTDVIFEECKLDFASFRFARLKRVILRDCVLTSADLGGAVTTAVGFERCNLERAQLSQARLVGCDLRSSRLADLAGVTALRGAIISPEQLLDLGPALAAELGLDVRGAASS